MDFLSFCRGHGIVIDAPPPIGVWKRCPTDDHPRKKNAAVILHEDHGFAINFAFHTEALLWKPDASIRPPTDAERAAAARRRAEREDTQEKQWARAAQRAQALIDTCRPGVQGYAVRKGFPAMNVLVSEDGAMVVPMRSWSDNRLVGVQVIKWLTEERRWDKRFMPGMRAKGAVFRLGAGNRAETILCEGWATAQSLAAAVEEMRLRMDVIACFSAGNVSTVAPLVRGRALIFADHDPSGVGQNMAIATGLPWIMSPTSGEDANDVHQRQGLRTLCALVLDLRKRKAP